MAMADSQTPSLTCSQLQLQWSALNLRFFSGKLPPIEITWSRRMTSSTGLFTSRVGPRHPDRPAGRRLIRLSSELLKNQPEQEVVGTLAHEMIHQWQFDILKRRPTHGPDFWRKMAEMNRAGLGITIRHDLQSTVKALCRYAWRCLQCGRTYTRHRRTIQPRRHRCGICNGALREITPEQLKIQNEKCNIDKPLPTRPRQEKRLVERRVSPHRRGQYSLAQLSLPFCHA